MISIISLLTKNPIIHAYLFSSFIFVENSSTHIFETIDDLQKAIGDYIVWYNEVHIELKRKGPFPL